MAYLKRLPVIFIIGGLVFIFVCMVINKMLIVPSTESYLYNYISFEPLHPPHPHHTRTDSLDVYTDAIKYTTPEVVHATDVDRHETNAPHRRVENNRRRYLLPLVYYCTLGPNSIYQGIRFAINYALHENRSIVQVPFNAKGSSWLDGMSRIKQFNETFDVQKLSELVPVSSISDFIKDCGRNIPLSSLVNLRMSKQNLTQDWTKRKLTVYKNPEIIEDLLGIRLPAIPDPGPSAARVRMNFETSFAESCIAVLLRDASSMYRTTTNYHTDSYPIIDKYLTRSSYIRTMAARVSKIICDGQPFAALHWRAMVERWVPNFDKGSKRYEARDILNLRKDEIRDVTYKFVLSKNITCMYISAPSSQKNMITLFKTSGLRIIDSDSLQNISMFGKDIKVFLDDSYKMSLLEQEICVSASIFIKNRWSNWSEFVEFGRTAKNKETHTYADIPGTPVDVLEGFRIVKK